MSAVQTDKISLQPYVPVLYYTYLHTYLYLFYCMYLYHT